MIFSIITSLDIFNPICSCCKQIIEVNIICNLIYYLMCQFRICS